MLKNNYLQTKKNHCLHDICFMFEFLGFKKKNVNYKNYCCHLLFVVIFVHFCSFLLLLLWSWQNLWQKNSAFRQSLTWWKNPKDCVLAVHGGRPKLRYIKCHPNFLVCFAQLWWRWKLAWKKSLISSYNVFFFIKAALCTCSVIFKIRVHCVGVIAVRCTM